ncbi:MAG: hypothetical protein KJ069_16270 [Anaerolineae bacterium]|nr:hypothetical protein [Anaerolineae bacterium]
MIRYLELDDAVLVHLEDCKQWIICGDEIDEAIRSGEFTFDEESEGWGELEELPYIYLETLLVWMENYYLKKLGEVAES